MLAYQFSPWNKIELHWKVGWRPQQCWTILETFMSICTLLKSTEHCNIFKRKRNGLCITELLDYSYAKQSKFLIILQIYNIRKPVVHLHSKQCLSRAPHLFCPWYPDWLCGHYRGRCRGRCRSQQRSRVALPHWWLQRLGWRSLLWDQWPWSPRYTWRIYKAYM